MKRVHLCLERLSDPNSRKPVLEYQFLVPTIHDEVVTVGYGLFVDGRGSYPKVMEKGVKELRKSLPNCKIEY
jgi:hypothetical protein